MPGTTKKAKNLQAFSHRQRSRIEIFYKVETKSSLLRKKWMVEESESNLFISNNLKRYPIEVGKSKNVQLKSLT